MGAVSVGVLSWAQKPSGADKPVPAVETPSSQADAAPSGSAQEISQRIRQIKKEHTPLDARQRLISLLGLAAIMALCWAMSTKRSVIPWRVVLWGTGLQIVFALFVLKTDTGLWLFQKMNDMVNALLGFTQEGSNFLFRSFVTGKVEGSFVNFTFNVLPTIIFFSSLMTVLYHMGVMQWIVKIFAIAMKATMKTSGAETLSTSANIFVGQTEAPLVIKPYVGRMTKSELFAVMVGGFANTAGGVLAAYVGMLRDYFPDIAGHLIAQSVMSAPAALACAKLAMPELEEPETRDTMNLDIEKIDANVVDAASRGASEGLHLAFNVGAMLLAFIALIAMANSLLHWAGNAAGFPGVSLEKICGYLFWPLAWIMGVPTQDCHVVGQLIGVKTVVNEFVAYLQLADLLKNGSPLQYRSVIIATYALSGFANFSSIAIQIGGISAIAPGRRHDLARLGLKAMAVGALATFTTATVAGLLI
ncbi:MAG: NupC/NupG family nucleoside CNT transporter [Elusimicrobia bacterium]|nr:NupC/NupG family nucleoside CNT transporter [Elusimicrobiota bacterium]